MAEESGRKLTAIQPRRDQDFPEWYQQVIRAADMAENSPVRGCMVIKPWGWSIWERIRDYLDGRIKATGHENAYFPLFLPLSYLEKEASHVEGFAKECAVVTHHRLEVKEGKLVPVAELEEPLVIRPTSETVIGEAFSRWVSSWRDLPLKINQWANVVRWEMRPRIFLRTTEFLWQEGHTAHASEEEARLEAKLMLEEYRKLMEDVMAMPVIIGSKSPGERFPGAVDTMSLECMTQDRKAIQAGTSHYLGQNFSKAFQIRFNTPDGKMEYAYTTSWGVTTRLIGAMIMVHGDDNGLCLPPKISPYHVVIIPVLTKTEHNDAVLKSARKLKAELEGCTFDGSAVRVHIDERDIRAGEKGWLWIKKGVPLRVEIGPKDIETESCVLTIRDDAQLTKSAIPQSQLVRTIEEMLAEFQERLFQRAFAFREQHIRTDITTFEEMKAFFTPKNEEKPEIHGGFVQAKWCGDQKTEELLKEMKVTIRSIPFHQSGTEGRCIITGQKATCDAIFAKSY
jgi:prolyl-tRNA synthetase